MQQADLNLTGILDHLLKGHPVEKNEIKYLLGLSDPEDTSLLFEAAQNVRTRYFGNKIFLYGFLYFSTHCRNNCNFCQYRQSNTMLPRYRKTQNEILTAAREMTDAGVHLIDLTMGEDPEFYSLGENGFNHLVSMIKIVQNETKLPVMISPGTLPDKVIVELAAAQVSWYACYQETHNETLYKALRQGQGFKKRLAKKQLAKSLGMLIEEGILTGVGETLDDLADSIIWMRDFSVDQARVMTFVPQAGTPMAKTTPQNNLMELIIIAVMRLVLPDRLIPASLDVNGLSGLKARLTAGANVVTSIVPPEKGLAGVANHSLDIEDSRRTLDHILPIVKACGLLPARPEEYLSWTVARQKTLIRSSAKKG
ncbi:MAG: methylornithine synthase PylB [Deltaproteobacteria bacterium]|uniref:methylornithine synthase PylB n=1 Tax=Desulfobacula sp. TaxID=2593537 RepID=UPI0019A66F78|nr:methylornithine synthase PylB [Candidatus Desulfobacula maris]MBL6993378.1 methylornithine synthase PylB [Desulfobacula sp.]